MSRLAPLLPRDLRAAARAFSSTSRSSSVSGGGACFSDPFPTRADSPRLTAFCLSASASFPSKAARKAATSAVREPTCEVSTEFCRLDSSSCRVSASSCAMSMSMIWSFVISVAKDRENAGNDKGFFRLFLKLIYWFSVVCKTYEKPILILLRYLAERSETPRMISSSVV